MARLRKGRANTARGAANFLRETVARVRYAGATGALTVRADSGFYAHAIVAVCRKMDVRFSITIRQHPRLRNLIEANTRDGLDTHTLLDGRRSLRCRDHLHSLRQSTRRRTSAPHRPKGQAHARLPTGALHQLQLSRFHHGPRGRHPSNWKPTTADTPRVENAIRDLKYGVGLNHLPSGRFAANAAWLAVQVMAHNLARWTSRIGLEERASTTKTLRRRFFSLAGRLTRSARRLTLHLPQRWPWETQFGRALARLRTIPLPN